MDIVLLDFTSVDGPYDEFRLIKIIDFICRCCFPLSSGVIDYPWYGCEGRRVGKECLLIDYPYCNPSYPVNMIIHVLIKCWSWLVCLIYSMKQSGICQDHI